MRRRRRPPSWASTRGATAWCGDIDITGHRRPQSYYREIVFGLRTEPYLAVQRPEHHGAAAAGTPWSWSDVVSSWSWAGHEGAPVTVEVYADADEVELLVNGRSASVASPAAEEHRYRSAFEATYEPGAVEAIAFRDGAEIGRTVMRSAGAPVLLEADRRPAADHRRPRGPGVRDIAACGRGRRAARDEGPRNRGRDRGARRAGGTGQRQPRHRGGLQRTRCTTFDGRALAIVRPSGEGRITLRATAAGCETQQVEIDARS